MTCNRPQRPLAEGCEPLSMTRLRNCTHQPADVQVLAIFAAAPELCALIKGAEAEYERFLQHPGRRPKGPHAEVLPFLAEQAQDWESCATATSAGSSPPAVRPVAPCCSSYHTVWPVLMQERLGMCG